MSKLAVIIATRGRPEIVATLVDRLARQTRPADRIIVVGSQPDDLAALDHGRHDLTAFVGRPGSSSQRNDGLDLVREDVDFAVFFDDDFIPSRYWLQNVEETFAAHPDLVGLTGTVIADGINIGSIPLERGEAIVEARDSESNEPPRGLCIGPGPYGCNMAFRISAIRGLSFDERLPMYAWLEDSDFGGQIARRGGKTGRAEAIWGVHLGHKAGRERGERLGYSQIANPFYIAAKKTLPRSFLLRQMLRNLAANLVRSVAPEPGVDRRGRLRGNLLALLDLVRGRLTPEGAIRL